MADSCTVQFRHWLPLITFCPVNGLPDFIYVTVTYIDNPDEIYDVKEVLRKTIMWKKAYMKDITQTILNNFPQAHSVTVRSMFNRQAVHVRRIKDA